MSSEESLRKMVEEQIIRRGGVSDKRVLDALIEVDRGKFIPESKAFAAYEDRPLSIGNKQTISQPYMVALMTSELDVKISDRVLEVGTGSGYQTAILAELAAKVFTVERIESLGTAAKKRLIELGYSNVRYSISDGTLGWVDESPFDKIMVTAASPEIPRILTGQLAGNGIMVIPVGDRGSQELKVVTKKEDNSLEIVNKGRCVFVPLLGEEGYKID